MYNMMIDYRESAIEMIEIATKMLEHNIYLFS
ncbi:hypothetical protein [Campylobacter ureolyticus]|nr:hypothetical protein [Campylobacter ureolyticus]